MQKILIISPHPQTHGGVVNFIETLKSGLSGYEIHSFFVGSRNIEESAFATGKRIFTGIFDLNRLAKQQKFDLIHINPSFNLKSLIRDGLLLLTLQRLGYKNIVVYFHGWRGGLADKIAGSPLYRKIFIKVFDRVAGIIVLAPEFKQQLEQIGIASDKILLGKTMFAKNLQIPSPHPQNTRQNILFISRFDKAKGIYELLQAFALIADKFPELDLIFAGDGKQRANLEKQAQALHLGERIKFPGYVNGSEKADLLANATIFILPTYFPEGMPIALLEAMAAGKPIITSCVGGIKLVLSNKNAIILEQITPQTIAEAIESMLLSLKSWQKIAAYNADYARENFSESVVIKEIAEIYRKIIAQCQISQN